MSILANRVRLKLAPERPLVISRGRAKPDGVDGSCSRRRNAP